MKSKHAKHTVVYNGAPIILAQARGVTAAKPTHTKPLSCRGAWSTWGHWCIHLRAWRRSSRIFK